MAAADQGLEIGPALPALCRLQLGMDLRLVAGAGIAIEHAESHREPGRFQRGQHLGLQMVGLVVDQEVILAARLSAEIDDLEHGKPLIFGKDGDKGLRLKPGSVELEVVDLSAKGIGELHLLLHDETNRLQAQMLAALEPPGFPVALGVLYCDPAPSYEAQVHDQLKAARAQKKKADLRALIHGGHTWTVPG